MASALHFFARLPGAGQRYPRHGAAEALSLCFMLVISHYQNG